MNRNDNDLVSIKCPHCERMVPVLNVRAFKQQQLLYMRCPECGKAITKVQIDEAYREYKPGTALGEGGEA